MGFSRVKRIKGIGLDLLKFEVKKGIRKDNRFILVSVGELNRNKNHRTVIKALSKLSNLDFLYLIIGEGKRMDYLKSYSYKLNIQDKVKFYGYLPNPMNIVSGADVFILPSIREGLPVALMEAMALGLPVVASNIRGVKELIIEGYNGYLFGPKMWRELRDKILLVISNKDSHRIMADKNIEILREYELSKVLYNVEEVYDDFISAMVSK
jgi:glycosyltransferase involved in cell wall biosynthesis